MCVAVLGAIILLCIYFDNITALQVLKRYTLVKGGAHTCCVNVVTNHEFTHCV